LLNETTEVVWDIKHQTIFELKLSNLMILNKDQRVVRSIMVVVFV